MTFGWLGDLRLQFFRVFSGRVRRSCSVPRRVRRSIRSTEVLESRVLLAAAVVELSGLNGTNGFRLNGIDSIDNAGISVSSAGDINGHGQRAFWVYGVG